MTIFKLDKVHSGVTFQVKHMMVSKTKGEFKDFDVDVNGDINNLEGLKVNIIVDAASIDTNNEDRDGHLRSADFFDVESYPNIKIESASIKKVSDEEYEMTAEVTIKDVTKTEVFTVEYNGTSKNPMDGSTVAGFDVEGKINREAYGLTWNAALETGGVLVGKDVKLIANFEFVIE
ncbi:YceI family protein [Halalkalibacter nanhaiisediminis]|uniref:Polyisoprenoid-binding protein YceI n=1 Tax=Halalkalibacter nanhaiisediminis TaxID=688079 RepID=A0A562QQR0_9BACI|nr:YceI family protein [Halalkalibacter nanhaiisediminis]TWI59092.1 polyisoprenoid-binding protein YceI [Halalkalibacter nanhaiisediminis]